MNAAAPHTAAAPLLRARMAARRLLLDRAWDLWERYCTPDDWERVYASSREWALTPAVERRAIVAWVWGEEAS